MATFTAYNFSRGLRENYGGNSDTYDLYANKWLTQIHAYGGKGNDTFNLHFLGNANTSSPRPITENAKGVSHGHHIYGDAELNTDAVGGNVYTWAEPGHDTYWFHDIHNVKSGAVIVGRLDDFDYSRDSLYIGHQRIDLEALPASGMALHGGGSVKVVEWHGGFSDHSQTQQWLLIESPQGGVIFYTLEGARIDQSGHGHMQGTAPGMGHAHGTQEPHFLRPEHLPDFTSLDGVTFEDPQNFVPDGVTPLHAQGLVINDADRTPNGYFNHVQSRIDNMQENEHQWIGHNAVINGSNVGDAIAGGLNADVIKARGGSDKVWGGGGHDTIYGGNGNDSIYGNFDDDAIFGESGADKLFGGPGNDLLRGGSKGDQLNGDHGQDTLFGDSGWDTLDGGAGDDALTGGGGSDLFVFRNGDGSDRIKDFNAAREKGNWSGDRIDLSAVSDITGYDDLKANHLATDTGGNLIITYSGGRIIVEDYTVSDVNGNGSALSSHDFVF